VLAKLISLLKPDVSTDAKLTGVVVTVGRELEDIDSRLRTQEIRSFIKGDKGEKGDRGRDFDEKKSNSFLEKLFSDKNKKEDYEIARIMERTWDKW